MKKTTKLWWTFERLEVLHNQRQEGKTLRELAELYGVGRQRIDILLAKFARVVAGRWRREEGF